MKCCDFNIQLLKFANLVTVYLHNYMFSYWFRWPRDFYQPPSLSLFGTLNNYPMIWFFFVRKSMSVFNYLYHRARTCLHYYWVPSHKYLWVTPFLYRTPRTEYIYDHLEILIRPFSVVVNGSTDKEFHISLICFE